MLKTTTCGGAEGVADGEQASLKAEGVAEGESHEGDGGAEELADFVEAGVLPAVFDPGDVAANEDAEDDGDGDVDGGEDKGGHARAHAECDRGDHAGEGDEREQVLEEGAVGVAADAAIGGLQELFELSEEDRDAQVEDDPLGVGFAEGGELEEVGGGKKVERAAEEDDGCGADEGDEPPAALEDAEGAFAIVAGDHHGHLVAGDACRSRRC